MDEMGALVTTEWLAARLGDPAIRIVDGSWYLPTQSRDPVAEYLAAHLPGAVFFDIDEIADKESDLPHMLPSPAAFSAALGALGIGNEHKIIVYDGTGLMNTAPRVWWMMRAFGHASVAVLDGGIDKWRAEGRPLDSGQGAPAPAHFIARLDKALVNALEEVELHLETGDAQIVDARSAGRFAGTDPEPRAGLPSGRMAGSYNVPFPDLIDHETHTLLPTDMLREKFEHAGVDLNRPIVTSCGSGVTACLLAFALYRLGVERVPVFDGSWTAWASRPNAPIARD